MTRGARNLTAQIGTLILINLVIGVTASGIDNAAHIGGLVAGCWLGFVMVPRDATSLRSFWTGAPKPGSTEVLVPGQPNVGPQALDGSWLVRLLGVGLLLAVIAAGVALGPINGFSIG